MDPLIYQYAVGGIVFAIGLGFAAKQGYIGLSGKPLVWLLVVLGGLLAIFGGQAYLQYAPMTEADPIPYAGGYTPKAVLGTPLDYAVMVGYFVVIVVVGVLFGAKQKDTKDFFFGGQRFSGWLIAFSLVASVVGSASFVKYSKIAFGHGLASTQTYMNDWFWLPLLLFGWLPILYFSRLTSIPEYFERRFSPAARRVATGLLLVYLIGYVGINLFTMGKALEALLGWDVFVSAIVVACISAAYVTVGGQTSVIMTDLFQGWMLLATGLVLLVLGADYLGGFDMLWVHLPRGHRQAFPAFNADPSYPAVGIFWQDGMANTAMFYFLNQGILMRFMAARSVEEGRKAAVSVLLILMPIAAIVVASGGWVGASFVHAGILPADIEGDRAFFIVAEMLATPGIFGLVLAALTAALMSTVDTLVTAVAAIAVNDVYDPLVPEATEKQRMRAARISSLSVSLVGVLLVLVFRQFDSIYAAHGAFTAAVTPPMVVALLLGVFWRRYTPAAAMWTLVGGSAAILASLFFPVLITPFAHGVPMVDVGDGLFDGMKQYKFMRAFYGIVVSAGIGIVVTPFTKPRPLDSMRGYVWGTIADALRRYKGSDGEESASAWAHAAVRRSGSDAEAIHAGSGLPMASISGRLAAALEADVGDVLYVSDRRAWLGGLYATHVTVGEVVEDEAKTIELGPDVFEIIVRSGRESRPLAVQRLY